MPQSTENKLKILIAVLSQSSNDDKSFLPTPNYNKLAADLGLPSYSSAKGVWRRLRDEIKRGDFGDLKIRDAEPNPPGNKRATVQNPVAQLESPKRKRAVEESNETADDSESSPNKKPKPSKRGQSKRIDKAGKNKVIKESNAEVIKSEAGLMENFPDWNEDEF